MKNFLNSKLRVSLTLILLDGVTFVGIFYLFTFIRHGGNFPFGNNLHLLSVPFAFTFLSYYVINSYSLKTDLISLNYTLEHLLASLVAAFLTILTIYSFTLVPAQQFSRAVMPLSFLAFSYLSLSYRRLIYKKASNHFGQRYFLILGAGNLAKSLFLDCKNSNIKHDFRVIDLKCESIGKPLCGSEEDGPIIENDLIKLLGLFGNKIDAIILAEDRRGLQKGVLEKLIYCHLQDTPVYSIEEFYENYFHKIPYEVIQPHILLRGGFQLARDPDFERFKRLTDIIVSLIVLTICVPFLIITPIFIRLDSKGPVIFKQERVGKNNRSITVLKFRTMEYGDSKKIADMYTQKDDPRITRVGKWLRLSRIDELPQLINVLKGEMSLIGPRAEWINLTQIYEKKIAYYDIRHLVKPGITGWAQVNYPYGQSVQDTIAKFEYDLYYVRNYSLKMDATIILKTIYTVLFRKGQ